MPFHRGSCVRSNPDIPRTRRERPCPRRTVAIPQTPLGEPGVEEPQEEEILLELVVYVGNHQQELRHRKPDEEADAHGNLRELGTAFVKETEVNGRLKSAPEPNFAPNVVSPLPLSTRIRFTVVVAAARGNRCNRTTGVEVFRRSHQRTRKVETEPPKQKRRPMEEKGLSRANITQRNKRGSERAKEGETETNKTSKRQFFVVFDQTKDEHGSRSRL